MTACIALAGADTGTGVLEWWRVPLDELARWITAVGDHQKMTRRTHG